MNLIIAIDTKGNIRAHARRESDPTKTVCGVKPHMTQEQCPVDNLDCGNCRRILRQRNDEWICLDMRRKSAQEKRNEKALERIRETHRETHVREWGVWCTVTGGVTGTRSSWLKSHGEIARFDSKDAAETSFVLL